MATTSIASNTELSRAIKASIRPSSNKPLATQQPIGRCTFNRFSDRFPVLSVRATSNSSMSKENSSKSGDGAGGGLTYKDAGVDIDAGSELVRRIAKMAPGIGGFGGLFPLGDSYLVAGTDGVGTKLKLAFETGIHETIGIDLVAMSVNDIVTSGAKPLFFLDYYATSRLDVDLAEKVIKGIVDGCQQSDCTLLGGEKHGYCSHFTQYCGNYQYGVAESLYMKDGFALNYPIKYIWPVLTHHKFLSHVKWSYSREFLKCSSEIVSVQLSFHEQSSATKKSSG
ncbi:hypothetical protein POTOM_008692 [Populus tomentosa]|uniref:PurM-like N-terminal domain-containing protein n=1 Tax=Populus tomentosa TaxID=118781 RepID=A0A8X8AEW6_POPTO|nr:hypothetical protein POTOM_008692 [Populus tomentosa]